MISCYLLYTGIFTNPFEAMEFFSTQRCNDKRGVTIPSQRRYIEYFADYVLNKRVYENTISVELDSISISIPNISKNFFKSKFLKKKINLKVLNISL
jgi:phosphatidylinositol-3,4,5-trisphosphate 3-phosphatase/dual-specificity protein phosphatase PTEN